MPNKGTRASTHTHTHCTAPSLFKSNCLGYKIQFFTALAQFCLHWSKALSTAFQKLIAVLAASFRFCVEGPEIQTYTNSLSHLNTHKHSLQLYLQRHQQRRPVIRFSLEGKNLFNVQASCIRSQSVGFWLAPVAVSNILQGYLEGTDIKKKTSSL